MKKNTRIPLFLMFSLIICGFLTSSCKKDDNPPPTTNVVDIDGNVYHAVTIGPQVWMVENLKTTKYRDGSSIPNVSDNSEWENLTTAARCDYNNDAATADKFGKLYNWYAIDDNRKIAPDGWHVATNEDWVILETFVAANLGASSSVAKAISSNTDWSVSTYENSIGNDLTKNNATGFTALPGGVRDNFGLFHDLNDYGYWWTSTATSSFYAWGKYLHCNYGTIHTFEQGEKTCGFSVRCVKD